MCGDVQRTIQIKRECKILHFQNFISTTEILTEKYKAIHVESRKTQRDTAQSLK